MGVIPYLCENELTAMKTRSLLFFSLIALFGSLSVSGSEVFDDPQATGVGAPAQSVDLGVRVVSHVADDGTVTTIAIGRADDAEFMAAHPTAKPLYFATGNLYIDKTTGAGRIGTGTEDDLGLNDGLFGLADTTGAKTSTNLEDYPSAHFSEGVSGNPAYDIARAKLGDNWRLPTAEEFAFLVEQPVTTGIETVHNRLSLDGYSIGEHSFWNGSPAGIILISRITGFREKSIFLPAMGYRSESGFNRRDKFGYYWLGSKCGGDFACYFLFDGILWNVAYEYRYRGFAVRPVSE